MYTSSTMDCERYQDLSAWELFGNDLAETPRSTDSTMMHATGDYQRRNFSNQSNVFDQSMDYLNNFNGPFYTISPTDSLDDVKQLATAPMEVVPMREHEALQIQSQVKREQDEDIGREEEVGGGSPELELNIKSEDSQDLDPDFKFLSEVGDDLIDFLVSEAPPQPSLTLAPSTSLDASTPSLPLSQLTPPLSPKEKPPMKSTYLAIPRGFTTGNGDDKKIPKMLILKTPQTTTINLQDLSSSIEERIKTAVKRPKPKRFEDFTDEEDSDFDGEPVVRRRRRRISTTSSTATYSDKYRELRDKNNEASRKSRQNRKEKERDLLKSLTLAERENVRLRVKSEELEKLVHSLRKILLQIVVSKGSAR